MSPSTKMRSQMERRSNKKRLRDDIDDENRNNQQAANSHGVKQRMTPQPTFSKKKSNGVRQKTKNLDQEQQLEQTRKRLTWAPEDELVNKKITVKAPPPVHHPDLWFMEREAQVTKAVNLCVKPMGATQYGGIERVSAQMPLKVLSITLSVPEKLELFGGQFGIPSSTVSKPRKHPLEQKRRVKHEPAVIASTSSDADREWQRKALSQVYFSLEASVETLDELKKRAMGLPDPTVGAIAADASRAWFTIGYTRLGGECQVLRTVLPSWRYYLRCRYHSVASNDVTGNKRQHKDSNQKQKAISASDSSISQLVQDGARLVVNVSCTGMTTKLR